MKKSLFAIAALAVAGLGFMGCDETQDTCGGIICADGLVCADTYNAGEKCVATIPPCETDQVLSYDAEDDAVYCVADSTGTCTSNDDCENDHVCDTETSLCVPGTPEDVNEYKYVRIDDLTDANDACCGKETCDTNAEGKTVCTKEDPGADIDAIALVKADGSVTYAQNVVGYHNNFKAGTSVFYKEGNKLAIDPNKALKEPNSLFQYGTADWNKNADGNSCRYVIEGAPADPDYTVEHYTFVSLGGKGGYLIVEMEKAIENNDTVDVLEVGNCEMITSTGGNQTSSKVMNEEVSVQVSVNGEDGWVVINEGAKATNGLISTKVTGL
jgi:hypothetical protein